MSATVLPGQGTLLQHATITAGTVGTYVTIAERVTIGGPNMSVGEAVTTSLDDAIVKTRGTILDVGELSLTIWYDPTDATHMALTTSFLDPTHPIDGWKLIFNNNAVIASRSSYVLEGWIKSFAPGGMDTDGNLSADVTIRMTKLPVLA